MGPSPSPGQVAPEAQHPPAPGIGEVGAAAVGLPGQVQGAGDGGHRQAGDHLHGVELVRPHVAEASGGPLDRGRGQGAEGAFGDAVAQLPVAGVEAQVVVDHQQGPGPAAGGQHLLGLGQGRRDRLLAVDGAHAGFRRRRRDLGVGGGVGGHGQDVQGRRLAQHLAPVGEDRRPVGGVETLPAAVVAAAAGDHVDPGVAAQGRHVGAVEVDHALADAVARYLVGAADEAQPHDRRAVPRLFGHVLLLLSRYQVSVSPPRPRTRAQAPPMIAASSSAERNSQYSSIQRRDWR